MKIMISVTTSNYPVQVLLSIILLVATTTTNAVDNDGIDVGGRREGEENKSMLRGSHSSTAASTQKNRMLMPVTLDDDDEDYYYDYKTLHPGEPSHSPTLLPSSDPTFEPTESPTLKPNECDWVEKSPEERCAMKNKNQNYNTWCKSCPAPCLEVGYSQDQIDTGTCFKPRRLEDLRFNKLPPYNQSSKYYAPSDNYIGGIHRKVYPLLPGNYPLGIKNENNAVEGLMKTIKRYTKADSVILSGDHELNKRVRKEYYNKNTRTLKIGTKDKPIFPGQDGFWEQLEHVVDVQIKRNNGDDPDTITGKGKIWPNLWAGRSLNQIADNVRGEYPVLHQQNCLESFWSSSPDGVELYQEGRPFRSKVDFVGYQVRLADINTWAFHRVAPVNFMLKWSVGMPRPEEVAWLIYTDQLTTEKDDVPPTVVSKIKSMNLSNSHDFTHYKSSGCPTHPSWPAMHSAGSTLSFWLPAIAKVTREQYCEALRVDYAVSYGRTIAGVHYEQDNIAGLNIGQNMIREDLPEYLSEKYGYDIDIIRQRLEALAFDWNDFNPEQCTIKGVDVGDFLLRKNSKVPTDTPIESPSEEPSQVPTEQPIDEPIEKPNESPSQKFNESPSESPNEIPSIKPTEKSSQKPSAEPSEQPSEEPSEEVTEDPTNIDPPSESPSEKSRIDPEEPTSPLPSSSPTRTPTSPPTSSQTRSPNSLQSSPTRRPTSRLPTRTPTSPPTSSPTRSPNSLQPSPSRRPTTRRPSS